MAFATEGFDFVNVVLKDGGVLTVVVTVEFGNVVDLDVVDDAGSQGAKAGGAVAIVFAGFEIFEIVVFEFLFEREVVEFATESKLGRPIMKLPDNTQQLHCKPFDAFL